MNESKWLKSFAKKHSLNARFFAERMRISVSASRSWIIHGLVPRQKYWYAISQCLGLKFKDVKDKYLIQLKDEGRLTECIICSDSIIRWAPNIILCRSLDCRKKYDLNRKRKQRSLLSRTSVSKYRSLNYLFNSNDYLNEVSEDKTKLREHIKKETEVYLDGGGRIVYLEPGEAEGTDRISLYLISHGLEDLIDD